MIDNYNNINLDSIYEAITILQNPNILRNNIDFYKHGWLSTTNTTTISSSSACRNRGHENDNNQHDNNNMQEQQQSDVNGSNRINDDGMNGIVVSLPQSKKHRNEYYFWICYLLSIDVFLYPNIHIDQDTFNQRLRKQLINTDIIYLRRELIEYTFICRYDDGSSYWRPSYTIRFIYNEIQQQNKYRNCHNNNNNTKKNQTTTDTSTNSSGDGSSHHFNTRKKVI